jgi:hypothetical protein
MYKPTAKKSALIPVKDAKDLYLSPDEARAARISAEFRERPAKVLDNIGEAKSLREHILRLSLFPNIYNNLSIRSGF